MFDALPVGQGKCIDKNDAVENLFLRLKTSSWFATGYEKKDLCSALQKLLFGRFDGLKQGLA